MLPPTTSDEPDAHATLGDSAAAYALGALDADEADAFARHLTACARCRAEVDEFRAVTALLAHGVPVVQPAPDRAAALRARVIGQARRTRSARRAWVTAGWLAAAASLTLAVVGGVGWRARAGEVARLQAALAARDAQAARAAHDAAVSAALLGPEVHVVSLAAPGAPAGAKPAMRVFWNHTRDVFVVFAHDLPPTPPGRTYRMWALARGRPPVSMGAFAVGGDGRATAVLPVPRAVRAVGFVHECAVTLEPAAGSAAPGEPPRFIGSWRHVD